MSVTPIRITPPGAVASSPTFEQPFEMLAACHERVARMLRLLDTLRTHVAAHGVDEQAQQAARDVMRYFDQAAPAHHRDEELHVFPPLVARGDAAVQTLVARLRQDHLDMEARWPSARAVLAAAADGVLSRLEPLHEAALEAFASLYGPHIAAEDSAAYPAALALLDADALAAMGQEMMQRRGVR